MKIPYCKPTISVEPMQLDQPVCANCTADFDDMRSLLELGYFAADHNCIIQVGKGLLPGHDTICYHSNVQTAFTS